MKTSTTHILTSQAGSLPRPDDLVEMNRARIAGEGVPLSAILGRLPSAVREVVERQKQIGIDIPGDGEYGHATRQAVDYGAWWFYAFERLGGLSQISGPDMPPQGPVAPGEIQLATFAGRRDRATFAAAYSDPNSGIAIGPRGGAALTRPTVTGPITYIGQEVLKADIANFRAALDAAGIEEGFMTAVAPGSACRIANQYYKTGDEMIFACAEAMREEYKAIVDAGFILQLDDPSVAENFDMIVPEPSIEAYQKFTMVRVEAINHAIKGLPKDRIRFHLCWGSWHGPHTTDIAMKDIVDVMLAIDVQGYSFEAGNVRHEHEWQVWEDVKLPDGKVIMPGVVSHATNVIEHPELVAQRIERFARAVGRENVIAGTDCGLGGRVHPQLAWAKLEALAEGAALASKRLWR
jgi:5-methyltetrahydropteroyltriglutamate--homocysteine methyltransferase